MQQQCKGLFILMLVAGFFCLQRLHAQGSYFIYIQTEAKIPYTVQMGDKAFYSNNTGYLLIPSLPPADYRLAINFSKHQFAAQTFLVQLAEKDRGFWLKQDIDNNFILLDQVSRESIRNAVGKELAKINYDNKVNKPIIDTISKNAKGERIKISNPNLGNGTAVLYKPATPAPAPATSVTKTYEKVGVNGINQAYAVLNGSKLDTVQIFIPALDQAKDLPAPVKKRLKEETAKEQEPEVMLNLPMPQVGAIPKKAKSYYK